MKDRTSKRSIFWKFPDIILLVVNFLRHHLNYLSTLFLRRPRDASHEQLEADEEEDVGPVIQFGGVKGRWTGSLHSNKNNVGIEARVNFETHAGERTMSSLDIGNSGTTVIYFNWKVLAVCFPYMPSDKS